MIAWTVQWSLISLILIILVHYLYSFFIDTLTVPKVRDLIHNPTERYNTIITDINKTARPGAGETLDAVPDQSEMQSELRDFLSNIKKEKTSQFPTAANDVGAYSSY
jgi:hypothetical protein